MWAIQTCGNYPEVFDEMTSRNIGIFHVAQGLILERTEMVAGVFAFMKFIPVRVEVLVLSDIVEYTGISTIFPEIDAGFNIPKYDLRIRKSQSGDIELVEAIPETL